MIAYIDYIYIYLYTHIHVCLYLCNYMCTSHYAIYIYIAYIPAVQEGQYMCSGILVLAED